MNYSIIDLVEEELDEISLDLTTGINKYISEVYNKACDCKRGLQNLAISKDADIEKIISFLNSGIMYLKGDGDANLQIVSLLNKIRNIRKNFNNVKGPYSEYVKCKLELQKLDEELRKLKEEKDFLGLLQFKRKKDIDARISKLESVVRPKIMEKIKASIGVVKKDIELMREECNKVKKEIQFNASKIHNVSKEVENKFLTPKNQHKKSSK